MIGIYPLKLHFPIQFHFAIKPFQTSAVVVYQQSLTITRVEPHIADRLVFCKSQITISIDFAQLISQTPNDLSLFLEILRSGFACNSEMTSRLKEDEKNERTIRNLLKLPENRRCINCNNLGPQYVCTNFWTFVCTTCSGIHREFTHRVKSVSMAKFTSQEVSALQGGGNASAKEIYFKEWDPQRQAFPDSSNIERLRDFIRHVYVDKRYTGEKWVDKGLSERHTQSGTSDVKILKNSNEERRSENGKSPDSQRDEDVSSPPVMRPVRDILGEKVSPLRIIEPPKADGASRRQRSVSTSSLASFNWNPVAEVKTESSLINFDDLPEPPPSTIQPSTSSNNNWANFDSVQETKTSHTTSNLLDVLLELSVPASFSDVRPQQSYLPVTGNQASTQADVKKELPADLFSFNYSSFGAPQYGMGFNMHYNVPAPMPPAYLQPSRPLNPFDAHGSSSLQATTFPSMARLQGVLPNMAPPLGIHRTSSLGTFSQTWMPTQSSTIQRTSSLGTPSPAWMPTQSSHPFSVSPQLPAYGSTLPYGQFMPPPRPQEGGFGSGNTSFRSFNHNQQQSGPSFFSAGGNPFG
ncbi:hypothetical protein L1887_03237 [Cichorium endivia]|nr:hypothetical protein L1887_03237 [Cichorium endivia]